MALEKVNIVHHIDSDPVIRASEAQRISCIAIRTLQTFGIAKVG